MEFYLSNITQPTAIIIIIGNEILSGRTKDQNINWIANKLQDNGIKLIEVRIIQDIFETIVNNVRELKEKANYIFTSGGIGPTHDDITTESVAAAFNVEIERNKEAVERLKSHYKGTNIQLNSARLKMADIPKGSILIDNPVSAAPGFIIENVYVMAGVPKIMQAMLDNVLINIKSGRKIFSISIGCSIGEGTLAEGVSLIEKKFSNVEIGCYPWFKAGVYGTSLVVRSLNSDKVKNVKKEIENLIIKQGGKPKIIS